MPTDAQRRNLASAHHAEVQALTERIARLEAIEAAARNLVKVKGRYHTEQAFKALAALVNGVAAIARTQEQT